MKKPNFAGLLNGAKELAEKRGPEILTGIGVATAFGAVFLTGKATIKAVRIVDDMKTIDKETCQTVEPTKKEIVKACWKLYIPVVFTLGTSAACIIFASKENLKRNAALAAAYKLSETALLEYKHAVVESIGEQEERVIRTKVAENKMNNNPVTPTNVIFTGGGDTIFYDPILDRYFEHNKEKIKSAENAIVKSILSDPFNGGASLNDFYDELGLPHSSMGDTLGWNVDHTLNIDFHAIIAGDESQYSGKPCLAIEYINPPKYDF